MSEVLEIKKANSKALKFVFVLKVYNICTQKKNYINNNPFLNFLLEILYFGDSKIVT